MYKLQIKFLANEEIKNKLLAKSRQLKITKGEYLRQLILEDEKKNIIEEIGEFKTELRAVKVELNYIGNNLNQIARKLNKDIDISIDEVVKAQENLSEVLKKLGV